MRFGQIRIEFQRLSRKFHFLGPRFPSREAPCPPATVGIGQSAIGQSEAGIQLQCLLEIVDRVGPADSRELVEMVSA